jgi:hypothetical protein
VWISSGCAPEPLTDEVLDTHPLDPSVTLKAGSQVGIDIHDQRHHRASWRRQGAHIKSAQVVVEAESIQIEIGPPCGIA